LKNVKIIMMLHCVYYHTIGNVNIYTYTYIYVYMSERETERQRETERTVDNDKKKQASSIWQVVSSTKKTDSCQIEKKVR
jgi:hypothetical protein